MNAKTIKRVTKIQVNKSYQGETIEQKIERIMTNNEPIKDGAPLIYTERDEGILPDYDPRTDRWDYAIDAMDKVSQAQIAKRAEIAELRKKKDNPPPVENPKPTDNQQS